MATREVRAFKPRGRQPVAHLKLLASLLYGKLDCITRHSSGSYTVETKAFCSLIKLAPATVRAGLELLKELGLAETAAWHRSFFIIKLTTPAGFAPCSEEQSPRVIDAQAFAPFTREPVQWEEPG